MPSYFPRALPLDGVAPLSFVTASLNSNQTVGQAFIDENLIPYILCYNDGGQSISTGYGLTPTSGASTAYSLTMSTFSSISPLAGIAPVSVPTANYFFLVTRGTATVVADSAGVSAGVGIILASNGVFSGKAATTTGITGGTGVGTYPIIGVNLASTTAAQGTFKCHFRSLLF